MRSNWCPSPKRLCHYPLPTNPQALWPKQEPPLSLSQAHESSTLTRVTPACNEMTATGGLNGEREIQDRERPTGTALLLHVRKSKDLLFNIEQKLKNASLTENETRAGLPVANMEAFIKMADPLGWPKEKVIYQRFNGGNFVKVIQKFMKRVIVFRCNCILMIQKQLFEETKEAWFRWYCIWVAL